MDNTQIGMEQPVQNLYTDLFSGKNTLIVILCILLILSILGINLLTIFGDLIQSIATFVKPVVGYVLEKLGYTAGTLIEDSADIAANVAKGGVDIADGVAHSIGGLLKDGSAGIGTTGAMDLANVVNQGPRKYTQAVPDDTNSPIQKPITASKNSWCLVGEMNTRRGCIQVEDADKCLSGQLFPTQQLCLNPNLTQNRYYK